jgi:hypothetical protein
VITHLQVELGCQRVDCSPLSPSGHCTKQFELGHVVFNEVNILWGVRRHHVAQHAGWILPLDCRDVHGVVEPHLTDIA